MTRYLARISLELYGEIESARVCSECEDSIRLPDGWSIIRVVSVTDRRVLVEVEDAYADPSLEDKLVEPWFQLTVDDKCVITNREIVNDGV